MSHNTDQEYESLRVMGNNTYYSERNKCVVSKDNVEIKISKPKHRLPASKEKFMLIHQSTLIDLAKFRLPGMDTSVLFYLLALAEYDSCIQISQNDIAIVFGCQQQMISRSLLNLKKAGLIKIRSKRGYGSIYFVNPYYFVQGNSTSRKAAIDQWEKLEREEARLRMQK